MIPTNFNLPATKSMIKIQTLDGFILLLMFALLPVDMINGIMLRNNINLPISVAQLYKIFLILFIFIRLAFVPKKMFYTLLVITLVLVPSIYQLFKQFSITFLFSDLIKAFRYLMPLFSFMFFVELIKNGNSINLKKLFKLVEFSYIILVVNILIKHLGFGYPIYDYADIGSKGYFYAGNEISVLLIILSAIIAFRFWKKEQKLYYYLFLLLNVFTGLTISSKTGILGILLVFFLIPINLSTIRINLKKLKILFLSALILFPIIIVFSWRFIQSNPIFVRFQYFWSKLDFWTFVLSGRNLFVKRAFNQYIENYNTVEKLIGVGQSRYEVLNGEKIVEIDVLDIFFAYGFIGLFLFLFLILFLWLQSKRFAIFNKYLFSKFVFLMLIVLLAISTIAGHVFSSGMAAVFIGLLFSLMYIREYEF